MDGSKRTIHQQQELIGQDVRLARAASINAKKEIDARSLRAYTEAGKDE